MRWIRVQLGFRKSREHRRVTSIGDPHFFAVKEIVISLVSGCRPQALNVRACIRFRERESASDLAGCESRQEFLLLFFGSEARENITQNGMCSDNTGKPQPSARDFFEHGSIGDVIEFETTILFGNIGADGWG